MTRIISLLLFSLAHNPAMAHNGFVQTYITTSQPAEPGYTTDTVEILIDHSKASPQDTARPSSRGELYILAETTGALWYRFVNMSLTGLNPNKDYTWPELIRAAGLPMTMKGTVTDTYYVGGGGHFRYEATSSAPEARGFSVNLPTGHAWGGAVAQCSFDVPGGTLSMDHGALMLQSGMASTRTINITANCNTAVVIKRVSVFGGSYKVLHNGDLVSILLVNGQESYTDYGGTSTVAVTSTLELVDEQYTGGPINDARIVLVEVI